MHVFRRSLSAAVVATLALSGLGLSAQADQTDVKRVPVRTSPASTKVAGLIVRTTTKKPAAAVLDRADVLLDGKAETRAVTAVSKNTNAISFDEAVFAKTAEAAAAQLEKRSDVVWAEPNYVRHAAANAPAVTPNDYFFPTQYNVWDSRTSTNSEVRAVLKGHNFPRGGYSVKAPDVWPTSTGDPEVVVAVLDTGKTTHSELTGAWLPGYDMISDDFIARDDEPGPDAHPDDAGDWNTIGECGTGSEKSDSSWHGTAVAGIIAAEQNNDEGISGIAPGVKIEPVRVLGRCGGLDSDIVAGITWASGGHIEGITDNPNPADVINLSLGGPSLTCPSGYQAAITAARERGSVVITAAGNDNTSAAHFTPGNCSGVINVAATDEYGYRASYSDYGSSVTLSAPGGDFSWDDRGIVSTWNNGLTTIGSEAYVDGEGTSFAAPAVSAGAALLFSLGNNARQTEAILKKSVRPFPTFNPGIYSRYMCTTTGTYSCGAGVFDLSTLPLPRTLPRVVSEGAAPVVGKTVSVGNASWLGAPTSYTYQWYVNNTEIADQTGSTYVVRGGDEDKKLGVKVTSHKTGYAPITSQLGESAPVRIPSTTGIDVPVATGTHGQVAGFVVNVTAESADGPSTGPVQIKKGRTVIGAGTVTDGAGTVTIPGTKLSAGNYGMTAKFLGAGRVGESTSAPVSVSIAKATSTVRANRLPSSIRRTRAASMVITIRVPGIAGPTGFAYVYDGSKRIATYTMTASRLGIRTVTLPKITTKGIHKVRVKYSGTVNIKASYSVYHSLKVY